MTPEAEADFVDLLRDGTMSLKRRALLLAVWEEVLSLRAEIDLARVAKVILLREAVQSRATLARLRAFRRDAPDRIRP